MKIPSIREYQPLRPPAPEQDQLQGYAAKIRTAVPGSERNQTRTAMFLALTAGYVDGYGLLILGTYVSFMSGNTTMAGLRAGQVNLSVAITPAIAIACFLAGSFVGNFLIHSGLRHARRVLFGLVAALLIIVFEIENPGAFTNLGVALLSFGMSMLNPALSQVGSESVSLTFVTGTLSRIGNHLALAAKRAPVPGAEGPWDTHLYRARIGAQLWASFFSGAVLSGIVMSFTSSLALVPPIAIMLVLTLTSKAETSAR
jgi:uncharacterized membrane protein YoaK (UPF0700 family)